MDVHSLVSCVFVATKSSCPVCIHSSVARILCSGACPVYIHSSATMILYSGANVRDDTVVTCVQAHR